MFKICNVYYIVLDLIRLPLAFWVLCVLRNDRVRKIFVLKSQRGPAILFNTVYPVLNPWPSTISWHHYIVFLSNQLLCCQTFCFGTNLNMEKVDAKEPHTLVYYWFVCVSVRESVSRTRGSLNRVWSQIIKYVQDHIRYMPQDRPRRHFISIIHFFK